MSKELKKRLENRLVAYLSNEKSTYTTLFTVDRAKDILEETIAAAAVRD